MGLPTLQSHVRQETTLKIGVKNKGAQMTNKEFLLIEYRKALRKGYFHYAWVILQNLHKKAKLEKLNIEISNHYVNEDGILFSN